MMSIPIIDMPGGEDVSRKKLETLTEQMFYVLLCLRTECYGMDILDRVPNMTGGRVSVGSGTLYNLLEQFAQAGMIRDFWMPNKSWEGCDVDDPSARALSNYGASGD